MLRNPFRPTELRERAGFVWLWVQGWPVQAIAQHTGTSVTTVYKWIRRWQREGNVETKCKSGRTRVSYRRVQETLRCSLRLTQSKSCSSHDIKMLSHHNDVSHIPSGISVGSYFSISSQPSNGL
ncbi:hypothetical protein Pcinc_003398 [Petrolisthes cinctipes]|uniref:Transposase n=1 Tax=Petrolisthes cinctipes TaxID=88211 RepID=A0AAE1L4R9_PETCI|nr:hypothetical protein Pcinc_003398 [Petrolisthes cinctipes]